MHKLIALYEKPINPEQFKRHLENTHLPLVSELPGLTSMRHGFAVKNLAGSNYFAIVECEFESEEAMNAALNSPQGDAAAADVPNYAAAGVNILTFSVEPGLDCERFGVIKIG